jgi:pyrroline-5-carboxylate reductase
MKVAIIGCGVMGSAFAKHFAKKHSVLLHDHDKLKAQALAKEIGAAFEENLSHCIEKADVVLLAIKPKDLASLAKAASGALTEKKILISILAGTPTAVLRKNFPTGVLVRTMPNLALAYGQGVVGLAENTHISPQIKQTVDSLLEGIGLVAWMSEEKIEALTALSGSGIGFVLVMIEAMIDGGVHLGFTAQEAREFVLKTMEGAVALMKETGKHPAELKLNIASPGGTTIAGLKVLEEEGVRSGIVHAMVACHEKALNMLP